MSIDKEKTIKWLGYADGALGLVPNLPGSIDDIGLTGARALIGIVRQALQAGRTIEELIDANRAFVADPAARLDVDKVVKRWLEKKALEFGTMSDG